MQRGVNYRAVVASEVRAVGGRGIALVVVGTALVGLAVSTLQWYRVGGAVDVAGSGFTFHDLRHNADQLNAPIAAAYFDWLAIALGLVLAVTGILANVSLPFGALLRVGGFLLGVAGAVGTYYALAQLFYAERAAGASAHGVLHNTSYGLWCAAGGFLLAGIGAALGPPSG